MLDAIEEIFVAVRVEVADAEPPWPVVLDVERVGNLGEAAAAVVVIQGIAPHVVAVGSQRLRRRTMLRPQLRLLQLGNVFLKRLAIHHVGVHVGHEDVHGTVVVVVEHADAHGAEGRTRKQLAAAADEALPAAVLVVLVVPLHVEHVEVHPAVPVDVERMGVAAPARVGQSGLLGYVGKTVAAQVAEQNAAFGVLRLQVVVERIHVPHVVSARADAIGGVGPRRW